MFCIHACFVRRNLVHDVHSRNQNTGPGGSYDGTRHFTEVKESIHTMHADVKNLYKKNQVTLHNVTYKWRMSYV